jgi:HSP20 family molecular chaperone IbpA
MPGVTIDDITVELDGTTLRLAADLRTPAPKDYTIQEFLYGSYLRELEIGPGFGAPVTATLGNGLLAVSVAKHEGDRRAERVEVQPVAAGASD